MLQGRTVLIVEREFLIALDIERMLESLNVKEVLFARGVAEARHLRTINPVMHLAIVEIGNDLPLVNPLLQQIRDVDVPLVMVSADAKHRTGLPELPGCPVVLKPIAEDDLFDAIGRALKARP